MKKKAKSKKIVNNPSSRKLLDPIQGMKQLIAFQSIFPKKLHLIPDVEKHAEQLETLQRQALELIGLPDKFNEIFAPYGWIAYESMSVEVMKSAISTAEKNGIDDAEVLLTEYYHDKNTLDFLFLRIRWYEGFNKRMRLLDLVREDFEAKRYHACIPLLLALIDGIFNDLSKHVGLFAENSDATVWDSIVGHETGLQYIISIFRQSRKKTNEDVITLPYRNGILHGKELSFDNPIVAAKCWAILSAVRDWVDSVKKAKTAIPDEKNISMITVLQEFAEHEKRKQRFEKLFQEWHPRTADELYKFLIDSNFENNLLAGSPEATVCQFLDDWKNGRYGKLVPVLYESTIDVKIKVGQIKQDYQNIKPLSFAIISINDEAPAISNIGVDLSYEHQGNQYKKQIIIRTVYEDSEKHPMLRNEPNGNWSIIQLSYSDLLYGLH